MSYERTEYPRPQFRRANWQSLNGEWAFDFGGEAGVPETLGKKICVPFSYQWPASGIGDQCQHDVLWYRRSFRIAPENRGRRALLCFNAADYQTDIWVNGRHALSHLGGFAPFHGDITDFLTDGENEITVRCIDTLDNAVPRGKQSWTGEPFSCFYRPDSGIWQSVWIEFFGVDCVENYSLQSDLDHRAICGHVETMYAQAEELEIILRFQDRVLKKQRLSLDGKRTDFTLSLADVGFDFGELLWWPDRPSLIGVDFTLYRAGSPCDQAHTRMGLRKITIDRQGKICLNDRPLYQRLILDQGYWPESGLTPPSCEALKKDIQLAKAMGFNGARKHQKLEDPYFYYYAEELGFLVWCEMPSAYTYCEREVQAITREWQEIVNYAKNFTSVIAYVPLNESWGVRAIQTDTAQQNFAKSLYYLTKALDATRLLSTNDGFETIEESDILGIHDYDIRRAEEFPLKYNGSYDGMRPQGWPLFADGHYYQGQPVLLTEFGGIAFVSDQRGEAWGYGSGAESGDALCARLEELIRGIAQTEFQGYCYTQLTDVQQEVNGLLYPDRRPKVEPERLKRIFEEVLQ